MGRQLQRALWLARIATVALGLVVVVALLQLQGPLGPGDEPPPGAACLGAEFRGAGPELPDGRRAALEDGEGLVDGDEDADQEGEQKVAFSLARIASLLGWGAAAPDSDYPEDAEPDRIRLLDMKPLSAAPVRASEDWANSALLRAFIARFGMPRATAKTRGPANLDDGELRDLEATSTPSSTPSLRTPSAVPDPQTRSTRPEVASTTLPPLPELPVCPLNGVITTQASEAPGAPRLGARLLEYAAAWLVSRGVGTGWRTPLVPGVVLRDVGVLLTRPSLPALEQLPPACRLDAECLRNDSAALGEHDLVDLQALPARFMDPQQPLVVHSGVLLPHLLAAHLPALRQELVLKSELLVAGRAVLAACRKPLQGEDADEDASPVRCVAVHARRGDVAPWVRGRRRRRPLGPDYFRSAMDHFRSGGGAEAKQVVFVVASDDPQWVRDNLGSGPDVCLTASPVDSVDLAALASCDVAVLDLGDTALASAILTAKQVVAPKVLRAAVPGLAALPGWTFL